MPEFIPRPADYTQLLAEVKERIRSAQVAALRAVNTELVGLYWDLGRMIVERQIGETWGKSVVEKLSADLRRELPAVGGFSASNLWRMKAFFELYRQHEKLAPLVREIAWAHNLVIMGKCKDPLEREFYLRMTRKFGWSKNVLIHQIENPSIGIILCKEKSRTIGVATYEITRTLPKELKGQLPRPEEIAALLEGLEP